MRRVCRVCGETKPIDAFYRRTRDESHPRYNYRQHACAVCECARNRIYSRRKHQEHRRVRARQRRGMLPNPRLDLAICSASWRQCLDAGPEATRRLVKKIAAVSGEMGETALNHACYGWLDDCNSLDMVKAAMGVAA